MRSQGEAIPGVKNVLDDVSDGGPQTVLVIGSDRRYKDRDVKGAARSDTLILVRLDPDKGVTAVMSIPRDLKAQIPLDNGGFATDKINAAYSLGGPNLTLRTVRKLTGIPINHIVEVNFNGFQRAVNRLKCVYVDVDHRYYHSNVGLPQSAQYAEIDIEPGYQKLCGSKSLDYVRFRHSDSDFVRAARQQDFLRQAKGQFSLSSILGDRKELLRIFANYTRTDLRSREPILKFLKLAFLASKNPIREVKFPATDVAGGTFVDISPQALEEVVNEFKNARASGGARQTGDKSKAAKKARSKQRKTQAPGLPPGIIPDRAEAEAAAIPAAAKLRLPVYFPAVRLASGGFASGESSYTPVRAYSISNRAKTKYEAYRMVLLHRRRRSVLRRAGDELEGPADPRQRERHDAHARAQVRAVLRRDAPAARRLAHAARRLLGLQHAVEDADQQADAGDRALADARRVLSGPPSRLPSLAVSEREPIGVIGTGYVGLVTAVGFAELGSEVWCIDIDADKIARLNRGEVPIYEPGLAESLERNSERLHFSTDLADALEHARLLFVAVGTPPTYSGDADLGAVHAVVGAMPPSDRHALVMKSTVPVGTGSAIKRIFAEQGKEGFRYVSCPEFLKEGTALADFLRPDRVVIGDEGDWAGDAVADLYRPLLTAENGGQGEGELVRTDIASAEMVKLAANAFLATKISFINEIANVCEETGADVIEVARGMGLDDRIGPKFLQAGIGFGGFMSRRRGDRARAAPRTHPAAAARGAVPRSQLRPASRRRADGPARARGDRGAELAPRVGRPAVAAGPRGHPPAVRRRADRRPDQERAQRSDDPGPPVLRLQGRRRARRDRPCRGPRTRVLAADRARRNVRAVARGAATAERDTASAARRRPGHRAAGRARARVARSATG